jgi:probable HAF family extracellular repeat protein
VLSRRLVYALVLNVIVGAATSAGALADQAPANRTYAMSALNVPGAGPSNAWGIDSNGLVVGQSGASLAVTIGRGGAVHDLGVPAGETFSWAFGLNEHGLVVGGTSSGGVTRAAVWEHGRASELPGVSGNGQTEARATNERGQVVGYSTLSTDRKHAVVWDNIKRAPVDLGTLPGDDNSEARGINDRGEIVGESYATNGPRHAVVWRNGKITALAGLGGDSAAYSINANGAVAGQSNGHAVKWDRRGSVVDLGTLPGGNGSWAYSINDRGVVVGGAYPAGSFYPHAVLFDHGSVIDLGVLPGGTQSDAHGINNHGEIVGQEYDASGQAHAVVWKPSRS